MRRAAASRAAMRRAARPRAAASRVRRLGSLALVAGLVAASCGGSDAGEPSLRPVRQRYAYPAPPTAPAADVASPAGADEAIDRLVAGFESGYLDAGAVTLLGDEGDPRHAWFLADLLRFVGGQDAELLVANAERLTGVELDGDPDLERSGWLSLTNHLIAWDTPAYPGYRQDKGALFVLLESRWAPFFADDTAEIDWRILGWGGVFIDDRELGDTAPCPGGCIPALDDPATTDAAGGDWYPDDRIVFGLDVGGEQLAIPLHHAEVHELFNLSLGGRRLAIPYCTLCGSAQAFFTDAPDGSSPVGAEAVPVLRTSGLLSRSNKVMYDLRTSSVFDTFTGAAVSGPLLDAGVVLDQTTVVRSTWGGWKRAHPETRIVAEDGGLGRSYDLDPLGGRDADGPIFPIGGADDRLDVQELVMGVIAADGTPVAFPSDAASAVIAAGGTVELDGVAVAAAGDGLVAVDHATGMPLAAHEAFWFAWSQFHPDTELWLPT